MKNILKNYTLLLGSKSPRRKELLEKAHIPHTQVSVDWDESYDPKMNVHEVAQYLSYHKAQHIKSTLKEDEIILTADTVVIHDDQVLGKPASQTEAFQTIKSLSNNTHKVITAITLMSLSKTVNASCMSIVDLLPMSDEEITDYIAEYAPFDKAGSYGIQDWIGICKINSIQGSYHNIMGLPVHMVYESLKTW